MCEPTKRMSQKDRRIRKEKVLAAVKSGISVHDVAEQYGLKSSTVTQYCSAAGVKFKQGSVRSVEDKGKPVKRLSHEERRIRKEEVLVSIRAGMPIRAVAKQYGLKTSTVQQYCHGAQIKLKNGVARSAGYNDIARILQRVESGEPLVDISKDVGRTVIALRTICSSYGVKLTPDNRYAGEKACTVCGENFPYRYGSIRVVCKNPFCIATSRDSAADRRNLAIIAEYDDGLGLSQADIATKYGITRQRVQQIIEHFGATPARKAQKKGTCIICSADTLSAPGARNPVKYCSSEECHKERIRRRDAKNAEMRQQRANKRNSKWSRKVYTDCECAYCGKTFKLSNAKRSRSDYYCMRASGKPTQNRYCDANCYQAYLKDGGCVINFKKGANNG